MSWMARHCRAITVWHTGIHDYLDELKFDKVPGSDATNGPEDAGVCVQNLRGVSGIAYQSGRTTGHVKKKDETNPIPTSAHLPGRPGPAAGRQCPRVAEARAHEAAAQATVTGLAVAGLVFWPWYWPLSCCRSSVCSSTCIMPVLPHPTGR